LRAGGASESGENTSVLGRVEDAPDDAAPLPAADALAVPPADDDEPQAASSRAAAPVTAMPDRLRRRC
jgi:hypothetical protein